MFGGKETENHVCTQADGEIRLFFFSLGCVLLECSTGKRPWAGLDNEWAIMFHIGIAKEHPPLPDESQLSPEGIDFIRKCLNIDAALRPTAEELFDHSWLVSAYVGKSFCFSIADSIRIFQSCRLIPGYVEWQLG